ncbi:MAG: ABC transporter ATP-binding protein [Betaproteobacteria bacterium]|nr:ABC transporter ATP-binding protein [Betaproteobacteria bacterium]
MNATDAASAAPLLAVRDLSIAFRGPQGEVQATRGIDFSLQPGERVGIVGESGCGKTVTGLSILGLLPARSSRVTGRIEFEGRDLLTLSPREMRAIRGARIGMIFQEPMSALDPVFTVGEQIAESLRTHRGFTRRQAREQAIQALDAVGIPLPQRRVDEYPHQLSGGMRQRAMIAIALACEPRLLIADEPTTALDVTIQAQIIRLLADLSRRSGTALLFITHDLGVVAETCDRLLTMYAGEVVEDARVDDALVRPRHPYTSGLLRSIPRLSPRKSVLPSVPGRVPSLTAMPSGCRFQPRCAHAGPDCGHPQALQPVDDSGRRARCIRQTELVLPGALA